MVEKIQLSKDLYYKRNKRSTNFIYFNLEITCKEHLKEICLIIINSFYICIYKTEIELSQILYIIVYVVITLIKKLVREQICESI